VNNTATGRGKVCLDRIKSPVGSGQRSTVSAEDGALVEEFSLLDSRIRSYGAIVRSPASSMAVDFTALCDRSATPSKHVALVLRPETFTEMVPSVSWARA
jgi:hypothetical protein